MTTQRHALNHIIYIYLWSIQFLFVSQKIPESLVRLKLLLYSHILSRNFLQVWDCHVWHVNAMGCYKSFDQSWVLSWIFNTIVYVLINMIYYIYRVCKRDKYIQNTKCKKKNEKLRIIISNRDRQCSGHYTKYSAVPSLVWGSSLWLDVVVRRRPTLLTVSATIPLDVLLYTLNMFSLGWSLL